MRLMAARQQIVDYGLKMVTSGLTTGSGGNLSILDVDSGLIAIGPSGIEYAAVNVEDVVIVDRLGQIVEGKWKPSSELSFHLALYRKRPEINAVVHTHSVYATTIACLNWEIPAVHYLVAFSGDKVPLAPYATFGSDELATSVGDHIGNYNALLLANHGLVAIGTDIDSAFNVAEEIELVARIYYQAKSIGQPVLVAADEMERVVDKFTSYGQQDGES
jgi:L-fuculose-phosphate aldolase